MYEQHTNAWMQLIMIFVIDLGAQFEVWNFKNTFSEKKRPILMDLDFLT